LKDEIGKGAVEEQSPTVEIEEQSLVDSK